MTTQKLACPHCDVTIKVPANLAGKRIKCPKCRDGFSVPGEAERPKSMTPRPRKALAPPPDDEVDRVQKRCREPRPAQRVRRKPAAGKSRLPLAALLAGVGLLFLGGIALAVVLWSSGKKNNSGASNSTAASSAMGSGPRSEADSPPANVQQVFSTHCSRCHSLGSTSRGRPGGRTMIDLSHVGADPIKKTPWIAKQIRNPGSHKERSQMPGFGADRISDADLQALSEYLAGLK